MTTFMGEGITRTSDPDAIMYDLILNFKEMMPLKITLLATSKKQAIKFAKYRYPTALSINPLISSRNYKNKGINS
ncbi:hypothetical protein AAF134_01030 [Synechococcus lacustris Tous-12m]